MTIAQGRTALIIVDVQPTFCEGGELGTIGAHGVAERVAAYAKAHRDDYTMIVTTQDWHIEPGDHFSESPDFVDTWPPHGVAGTQNAELHPALEGLDVDIAFKKGQYAAAYSGFEGTSPDGNFLADVLAEVEIAHVDVVGLVESHCVKSTALDAKELGYSVRVFTDLTVPVTPEQGETARAEMTAAGIVLEESA